MGHLRPPCPVNHLGFAWGLELLDLLEMVQHLRADPLRYDLVTLGFDRGTQGLRPTLVATEPRDHRGLSAEETRGVNCGYETPGVQGSQALGSRSNEG